MKLVIIIPALNEERTIGDVITTVPSRIDGVDEIEIIVVDDGSTDRTKCVAISAGASVISHCRNEGVGAAFKTGIKAALMKGADVIVNIDADGQFDPQDIPVLVKPVLEGKADFVTASRFKEPSLIPQMPKIKIWGNKKMAWLISLLTGDKFYDVSCGFRAYSRDTALKLTLVGQFTYTQETFLDLAFKGATIVEIPLVVRGERGFGESRVASNLWKYAAMTSKIIFRAFRDYKPLRFFGIISLPFLVSGTLLEIFLILHYILSGQFSPHKWAGFSGASLIVLGLIFFIIGLVADMLDRIRLNQEELLYFERERAYSCQDRHQT
ncbi:MAG: glycosyltransferase family 2 protein [Sedimentisphaerales bacterium]